MANDTQFNIVLADSLAVVRHGAMQIIESDSVLRRALVTIAKDRHQALEAIRALTPCVALLDYAPPKFDGLALARALHKEKLAANLILFPTQHSEQIYSEARRLGFKGYLLKDSSPAEIAEGLRGVAAGKNYFSPKLLPQRPASQQQSMDDPRLSALTPTERQVMDLIGRYATVREIASELSISQRTVETHCHNMRQKLNLRGTNSLLRFIRQIKE